MFLFVAFFLFSGLRLVCSLCLWPLVAIFITVEFQWLEHLWNHENMFETGVVRARVLIIAVDQGA